MRESVYSDDDFCELAVKHEITLDELDRVKEENEKLKIFLEQLLTTIN